MIWIPGIAVNKNIKNRIGGCSSSAAAGLGVNPVEPIELAMELDEGRPMVSLLAGRHTLLDHERALQRPMPQAAKQNVAIVVGGPYSSGILVGITPADR